MWSDLNPSRKCFGGHFIAIQSEVTKREQVMIQHYEVKTNSAGQRLIASKIKVYDYIIYVCVYI